jgi:superfamily I DNA/RNA helicase
MFFVATTRARERLYMSYSGKPHRFIDEIEEIDDELLVQFTGSSSSW